MGLSPRSLLLLALLALALPIVYASSGDRNPTFQHCLRGCSLTYCDPSQPPIPLYLRLFGWTCAENCAYECAHSFTDHIRPGSRYHQFYGKWAFYRLGPFQEPVSILMSIGNLYVNLQGVSEVRRRIRPENKLRPWLLAAGYVQVNTWVWSAVFHARDTPTTERLDYFSATLTISFTLLYALLRIFHLQTPLLTTRFLLPTCATIAFLVLGHFTYLLSFPLGSFPYGYHTLFNLVLALVHNTIWVLWSFSFKFPYPSFSFSRYTLSWPRSYPPHDAYPSPSPSQAGTPALLVALTTLAMSLELWDFSPLWRLIDAHSLWHFATIPLAMGWWSFLVQDAIELEGALMGQRGMGVGEKQEEKEKRLREGEVPRTPTFRELASGSARLASPSPSPGARVRASPKAERNE
ncbi:hypothetical protein L198_01227 [Cryptococcus wingfieldii CBS 7118]|uniref:Post-GPI attachment to proteins factor 3 n=1 Tax=Cryptococcus wingfieldii CBS 7118 TaxID=1295528 RepID=A0A1E3K442_9TREE|nr:hypothetical protein L198_01227 [Cryptococcus wingfieldii CBS 7118]ODO07646.1 hypothetical protein L198_01227 [Cryptococcus wingfieldii CBS 7118]